MQETFLPGGRGLAVRHACRKSPAAHTQGRGAHPHCGESPRGTGLCQGPKPGHRQRAFTARPPFHFSRSCNGSPACKPPPRVCLHPARAPPRCEACVPAPGGHCAVTRTGDGKPPAHPWVRRRGPRAAPQHWETGTLPFGVTENSGLSVLRRPHTSRDPPCQPPPSPST